MTLISQMGQDGGKHESANHGQVLLRERLLQKCDLAFLVPVVVGHGDGGEGKARERGGTEPREPAAKNDQSGAAELKRDRGKRKEGRWIQAEMGHFSLGLREVP